MRKLRGVFAFAVAVLLAGCAAQNGPSPAPFAQSTRSDHRAMQPATEAPVQLTFDWSRKRGKPHTIVPTALSASVLIQSPGFASGSFQVVVNRPRASVTVDVPVGAATFTVTMFDGYNGDGTKLSRGSLTTNVVGGKVNKLKFVLDGFVATVTLALANPTPAAGKAATIRIVVSAFDADGNLIVGPGGYDNPVHLTLSAFDPAPASSSSSSSSALPASVVPEVLNGPHARAAIVYTGGTLFSAKLTATGTGVTKKSIFFVPVPTIYEASLKTPGAEAQWIAPGYDGRMWFTEYPGNAVGAITSAGVETDYPIPTSAAGPNGIAAGANGDVWFTEFSASKIGSITTGGTIAEFATKLASDGPMLITDGGDGNVWYTGFTGNDIGFQSETVPANLGDILSPTGGSGPFGIAANVIPGSGSYSGNKVYFTENTSSRYGAVWQATASSKEALKDGDAALTVGANVKQIVVDASRSIAWVAESGASGIRKGSTKKGCGVFLCLTTFYATPTANAGPTGAAIDLDGNLWFTEANVDKIGEVNLASGVVTEYPMPSAGDGLQGIAMALDGSLWITETKTGRLARLVY
ncbi:MAG: hypothetical protein JO175_03475 [Candidatus Eremiobacteraeota bacterium]|nr:hypothetical protein [Candidatus Eremiobacteraeota bacterium]